VCSNVGADGLCGQWVCSNVGAWVLKHAGAVRAAMWVQCVQRMNLLHVAYGVQGHMVCCIPCVQDTVVRKAMSVIHWFVVVHLKLSKIVTWNCKGIVWAHDVSKGLISSMDSEYGERWLWLPWVHYIEALEGVCSPWGCMWTFATAPEIWIHTSLDTDFFGKASINDRWKNRHT